MKIIRKILLTFLLCFCLVTNVGAKEKVKLYLFHNYDCPHCKEEKAYLEEIVKEYENLEIVKYELKKNVENQDLFLNKIETAGVEGNRRWGAGRGGTSFFIRKGVGSR